MVNTFEVLMNVELAELKKACAIQQLNAVVNKLKAWYPAAVGEIDEISRHAVAFAERRTVAELEGVIAELFAFQAKLCTEA